MKLGCSVLVVGLFYKLLQSHRFRGFLSIRRQHLLSAVEKEKRVREVVSPSCYNHE